MHLSSLLRLLSLACLFTILTAAPTRAQPPAGNAPAAQSGPPIKTGRLLEVETKGRLSTLKIETTEGETYEVRVTPQLDFFVVGPGDASFVKPGVYVAGRGVMTNNTIFLTKVSVYLLPRGRRAPAGRIQKVMAEQGESLNAYEVSGELTAMAPAEGYPDHTALALKIPGRVPPVWLEPGYQVEVNSANPQDASAGADVEMAMKPLRGNRLTPVAIRVHREAAFAVEGAAEEPKSE